ncbi:COG4315 family predicted lipoprotein [Burkholderia sp. TSV86]|uniref:COG4315 family predicted lipoprotein n=1 Tax=Burkholderia sp. TSV86 TaxID=1385594 RepID=UPI000755D4C3|nr:hypothetical protein [Burkholderia sp. TSV86]KVE38293.1 hypothetical protein WS68_23805 [Burkholderia sp. TSV86]
MKIPHALWALALGFAPFAALAGAPAMDNGGTLVAANGMTLYTFDKDAPNSGKSTCNGSCATNWPPYKASASDQPAGAYTIIKRDDGSMQWAYAGKPLYFFAKDSVKGDKKGDRFKEVWHVVRPSS